MTIQWIGPLGDAGVISDRIAESLPPNVVSDAQNVRFRNGEASRISGNDRYITPPTTENWIYAHWLQSDPSIDRALILVSDDSAFRVYFKTTVISAGTLINDHGAGPMHSAEIDGQVVINTGADRPERIFFFQQNLPDWDNTWTAKVLRRYKRFLVALNMTEGGTQYGNRYRVSEIAISGDVPQSWTPGAGSNAIVDTLDAAGVIIWAEELGEDFIIYTDESTHVMTFTGDIFVMQERPLLNGYGILAGRCAIPWNRKHFVAERGRIYVHDGRAATDIISGKAYEKVFPRMDTTNYTNSFCVPNRSHDELWFCFPETGAIHATVAAMWNWKNNTWAFRELPNARYIAHGLKLPPP